MRNNNVKNLHSLIDRLNRLLATSLKYDRKLSYLRLVIFVLGITATLLGFFLFNETVSIVTLILSIIVFSIVAHSHSKLNSKIKRLRKWIIIQEENKARQNLDWENIPFKASDHESPNGIEYDLNLVGKRSLFTSHFFSMH